MKKLMPLLILSVVLSLITGCATSGEYKTHLAPPDAFNPIFLRYQELATEKVMVIAVDPGGNWAFGYDHNRGSLKEAAEAAAIKCDHARTKHMVLTQAKIFAINDEIVYYKKQLN